MTNDTHSNRTDNDTHCYDVRPNVYVPVINGFAIIRSTPDTRRRKRIREMNRLIRRLFS